MLRLIGLAYLKLFGWRLVGEVPPVPRCVVIAAPHTSNWDLPHMLAVRFAMGLQASWLGKHTIFIPPFGWLFRLVGGVPIDRRSRHDTVKKVANIIRGSDQMLLAISPEGTRSHTAHWRSGFYRIALMAEVPVCLAFLDYQRREGGFGPTIVLTGDETLDLAKIRDFYASKKGHRPENFGPIRFWENDEDGHSANPTVVENPPSPAPTPESPDDRDVPSVMGPQSSIRTSR